MTVKIIVLVGYFGSGKATLLLRLSEFFINCEKKVGVLVNDVGSVDFEFVASGDNNLFENISKHCLCMRVNDLEKGLKRILESEVEIILVETIGFSDPYRVWTTITSLTSALEYPVELNPITVLVDGDLLLRLCQGLKSATSSIIADTFRQWLTPKLSSRTISEAIIQQQLLQADVIVVNKCDLLSSDSQATAEALIREINTKAKLHFVSATAGFGVKDLFSDLMKMKWMVGCRRVNLKLPSCDQK